MKREERKNSRLKELPILLGEGIDALPINIEIHPTDICNERCEYCFHKGTGFDPRRVGEILPLDNYITLFQEMLSLGIMHLSVSGGGEPFADKRTPQLLDIAQKVGLSTRVITNGTLLNEEAINTLINSEEVRFSLDAASSKTYSQIRKVPEITYNIAIGNLKRLIKERCRQASEVKIGVTFLINDVNYSEVEDFVAMMKKIGVDFIIIKYNIYGDSGLKVENYKRVKQKLDKLYDLRLEIRDKLKINPRGTKCFIPHFDLAVNPYGEVFSCCLGAQPRETSGYLLGNLHSQSLSKIWESSKTIRLKMKSSVRCNNCNYTDYQINMVLGGLNDRFRS